MKNYAKFLLLIIITAGIFALSRSVASQASASVGEPGGVGVQMRPQDRDGHYGEGKGSGEDDQQRNQNGYGND